MADHHSNNAKKGWTDERRAAASARAKANAARRWSDPEQRRKQAELMQKLNHDKQFVDQREEGRAKGDRYAKVAAANRTPERRAQQAEQRRRLNLERGPLSQSVRDKIALSVAKWREENLRDREPNPWEASLFALLEYAGFDYEPYQRFGRYEVDAYVPSHRLVFEVDGTWPHHLDHEREVQRDGYLLDHGAIAIIHFREADLRPWLRYLDRERLFNEPS